MFSRFLLEFLNLTFKPVTLIIFLFIMSSNIYKDVCTQSQIYPTFSQFVGFKYSALLFPLMK